MNKLPFSRQVAYGFGMMGWSIMVNLISVIVVYLYAPTGKSGFPDLITQVTVFGIFNVIALVTGGVRFVDAIYDPFIAQYSDRSKNPKGRRIPVMKWAIIPSVVFCCLVFYPVQHTESSLNVYWLIFTLIAFYISSTSYNIPYNALLPELAPSSEDKVKLSTWQSVGYILGVGFASAAFNLTDLFQHTFHVAKRINALQCSVVSLAVLGGICMLIPILAINEKQFTKSKPSHVPIRAALRQTLTNKNFLLFIVADFAFFLSVTIITTGLMYFLTVLLKLHESLGNTLMITMVLCSFLFYPLVFYFSKKIGHKPIVIFSLIWLSVSFLMAYFLGKMPFPPKVQIFGVMIFTSVPVAALNILPNAILAGIIQKDTEKTGENKEAIYFAVRYFFVKIAQTIGIALFSMFLIYGKEDTNDFGVRLNGLVGFGLCFVAALIFSRFKEVRGE